MFERLVGLSVDESKWLTASMGFALLAIIVLLCRHRHSDRPARRRILAAMNLFFGVTIGTMALGHLLAVTTKLSLGTLGLNAWLAITLLALGLHNLPLAAPGLLNMAYHEHSGRAVGWAIVGLAVVVHASLFIGSLIFLASGQSFEQFQGGR